MSAAIAGAASAVSQHGWQYQADLTHLAEQSDVLVVACPGGPGTQHLVNARVLQALGQQGFEAGLRVKQLDVRYR